MSNKNGTAGDKDTPARVQTTPPAEYNQANNTNGKNDKKEMTSESDIIASSPAQTDVVMAGTSDNHGEAGTSNVTVNNGDTISNADSAKKGGESVGLVSHKPDENGEAGIPSGNGSTSNSADNEHDENGAAGTPNVNGANSNSTDNEHAGEKTIAFYHKLPSHRLMHNRPNDQKPGQKSAGGQTKSMRRLFEMP